MFKAIAVDDNKIHLNEILSIVEWRDFGIDIVQTFPNGQKALNAIKDLQPDIVITDIMMPVMNGLELAHHVNRLYPHIKIIFISSADDFDTAKTAVSLNVGEYILKPLDADEVKVSLSEFVRKFKIEKSKNDRLLELSEIISAQRELFIEQFLREALYNEMSREEINSRLDILSLSDLKNKSVSVINLRVLTDDDLVNEYNDSLSVKQILSEFSLQGFEKYIIQMSINEFVIICFLKGEQKTKFKSLLYEYCANVHDTISLRCHLETMIAFSPTAALDVLFLLFRQSRKANAYNLVRTNNLIIAFDDIDSFNTFEKNIDFNELFEEINNAVFSEDDSGIRRFLHKYFVNINAKDLREYLKSILFFIVSILGTILINEHQSFKDIFGDDLIVWKKISNFDNIYDVKTWMENIIRSVREHLRKDDTGENSIINKIKSYIRENYAKDISLSEVADLVFYSVRQANYLFKNKVGVTIYEYLVEYRMEIAKKLLITTKMKAKDIAEAVGYASYPHFRLVFKKFTNMTPGEYKQKNV